MSSIMMFIGKRLTTLFRLRRKKKYTIKPHYTSFRRRFFRLLLILLALVVSHTFAMMYFEGMDFGDGLWLTVTTLNTVGYGDLSSSTAAGRVSTVIVLYTFGIALLGVIFAEFMDYKINLRDLKLRGLWSWKHMRNHILIINTPLTNSDDYLAKFIGEMRKTPALSDLPIQIVTRKYDQGLPGEIAALNVVHCHGHSEDSEILKKANVAQAKFIFLLARAFDDSISDSLTFDILSRINEIGSNAAIAAEVVVDKNRQRCKNAGADVVVRPMRAYPELLIRALSSPGTEEVLENLFSHDGTHMERVDCDFAHIPWKDLVIKVMNTKAGMPVAFIDEGKITVNPPPDAICSGQGLITMVYEEQSKQRLKEKVEQCLLV